MNERKNEIRVAMKARRKTLTPEERTAASEIICAKLAGDSDIWLRIDLFEGWSPVEQRLIGPVRIWSAP